jgi:hypothetical protein
MKPTDNKVIFNGVTYNLVLDEPEPAPEWKPREGELCEFWDFMSEGRHPATGYFDHRDLNNCKFVTQRGTLWNNCRPLQDPNIIQMIPHDGGECPVPEDADVLVRFLEDGMALGMASGYRWKHINSSGDIMAYAVLK